MEKIPEAIGWGMIPSLMRISALPGYRYGVALLFVGAALVLSLLVQPSLPDGFLVFFLSAVMLAGWFGRTGAGLFAVVVSMPAVGYTGQRLRGNGFVPLFRPHSVRRENPVAESLTVAALYERRAFLKSTKYRRS